MFQIMLQDLSSENITATIFITRCFSLLCRQFLNMSTIVAPVTLFAVSATTMESSEQSLLLGRMRVGKLSGQLGLSHGPMF